MPVRTITDQVNHDQHGGLQLFIISIVLNLIYVNFQTVYQQEYIVHTCSIIKLILISIMLYN